MKTAKSSIYILKLKLCGDGYYAFESELGAILKFSISPFSHVIYEDNATPFKLTNWIKLESIEEFKIHLIDDIRGCSLAEYYKVVDSFKRGDFYYYNSENYHKRVEHYAGISG